MQLLTAFVWKITILSIDCCLSSSYLDSFTLINWGQHWMNIIWITKLLISKLVRKRAQRLFKALEPAEAHHYKNVNTNESIKQSSKVFKRESSLSTLVRDIRQYRPNMAALFLLQTLWLKSGALLYLVKSWCTTNLTQCSTLHYCYVFILSVLSRSSSF